MGNQRVSMEFNQSSFFDPRLYQFQFPVQNTSGTSPSPTQTQVSISVLQEWATTISDIIGDIEAANLRGDGLHHQVDALIDLQSIIEDTIKKAKNPTPNIIH